MILHPDGRVEGTPEEVAELQERRANPPEINRTFTWRLIPGPNTLPPLSGTADLFPWWKTQTWISSASGGMTCMINHRSDGGPSGVTANLN